MNCLLFFALFIVTLNKTAHKKYIGFLLGSCKTWIADHRYFLATTPIIIDA